MAAGGYILTYVYFGLLPTLKDYYAILGLDTDASPESMKIAYRRLAREARPDRVGHLGEAERAAASTRMAELNEAYSTLSDNLKRKEYESVARRGVRRSSAESGAMGPPPRAAATASASTIAA